ncbi:MAG: hypothetical protein KatS3mg068_1978 [Candidatus Sericytochromatia bacterium]|nr:MAG: hypothetical protein KatS3mg068_1978 [Candidatus Sericytochromatia bacterium]
MKNNKTITEYEINKDAFLLNQNDFYLEKKYHFRIKDESFSIFKNAEEPYIKVFLKALTYYLYKPIYNNLQIDLQTYKKYKADLVSLDYSNEPIFWAQLFERDFEKIEYLCRHLKLDEFVLVEINDNIFFLIENLKNKVHYKYHHLIKIINFIPEIIYYVDTNDIVVFNDWYSLIDLL